MYAQGDVTVDDRFARFGSKSYAINKINSVDVRSTEVPGSWAFVLWWALGASMLITALSTQTWGLLVVSAVLFVPGWSSWKRRRATTVYSLFLVTSSNEAQATKSIDGAEIERLRTAIEDAMARSN